jgi:hypothetical protein
VPLLAHTRRISLAIVICSKLVCVFLTLTPSSCMMFASMNITSNVLERSQPARLQTFCSTAICLPQLSSFSARIMNSVLVEWPTRERVRSAVKWALGSALCHACFPINVCTCSSCSPQQLSKSRHASLVKHWGVSGQVWCCRTDDFYNKNFITQMQLSAIKLSTQTLCGHLTSTYELYAVN